MSTFYTADLVFVSGAFEPGMYVEVDDGLSPVDASANGDSQPRSATPLRPDLG